MVPHWCPISVESTGGYRFNTKDIESTECVVGHPCIFTNIFQRGAMSQHPGGCNTPSRVSLSEQCE